MANYGTAKTGQNMTSWDYYVVGNNEMLKKTIKAEKAGDILDDSDNKIASFKKGISIKLLDTGSYPGPGKIAYAKVQISGTKGYIKVSHIQKLSSRTTKVSGKAGIRPQERQEFGVIEAIEGFYKSYKKPFTIINQNTKYPKLTGITAASKNDGTNQYGKEPYVDVWVHRRGKKLGISNKGASAPSVAGGGLEGMYRMDSDYMHTIFNKALSESKKSSSFEIGSTTKLSDIFVKINSTPFIKKMFVGTAEMGGPVDYMYIGDMDVDYEADSTNGTLKFLNGSFITVATYIREHPEFWFRIRRRDVGYHFTTELDDRFVRGGKGLPFIFKKGQRSRSRLVVSTSSAAGALVIRS